MGIFSRLRARLRPADATDAAVETLLKLEQEEFILRLGAALRLAGCTVDRRGILSATGDLVLCRGQEKSWFCYRYWRRDRVGLREVEELHRACQRAAAAGCTLLTFGRIDQAALDYAVGKPIELLAGRAVLDAMPSLLIASPARPSRPSRPSGPVRALSGPRSFALLGRWSRPSKPSGAAASDAGNEWEDARDPGDASTDDLELESVEPCPRCGRAMSLRVAAAGHAEGFEFWACENYPSCKGTRPA